MNTVSNSVNSCAICLNETIEGTREELSCFFLPAFIQKYLNRRTVLTLKRCGHKFHLEYIRHWTNELSGCPLDRRLIVGSSHPALLPINVQKKLLKSIEKNRIGEVQEILLAGLTPEQFSCRKSMNPLTMALKNDHWEIAALLLRVGWSTEDIRALNNLGWMYSQGLGGGWTGLQKGPVLALPGRQKGRLFSTKQHRMVVPQRPGGEAGSHHGHFLVPKSR